MSALDDAPRSEFAARAGRARAMFRAFASNHAAVAGFAIVAALALVAIAAPILTPLDPDAQDLALRLAPPNAAHLLGTDELGRDILARLLYGARVTLTVVAMIGLTVPVAGLVIGCLAGLLGGWVDVVLMRVADVFLAFPRLILALALVAALGPGLGHALLAIGLAAWPPYARLARAETLAIAKRDFIAAARLAGASPLRLLLRHIAPLCLPSLVVRASLDMAGVILTAAGLGFLGLGVAPPTPEWGAMIAAGRRFMLDQWWVAAAPGIAIAVATLGFNLLGEGLRDVLDPAAAMSALLEVDDLRVRFGDAEAVRGVSFALGQERLALVGGSGAGKSLIGRAILRLLPAGATMSAVRLAFDGIDLLAADARTLRRLRGRRIGWVLQDPKFSLNPVMTVGAQIAETLAIGGTFDRKAMRARALELLDAVRLRDPERVLNLYPHELSGGMGQRAMIAMMLAGEPQLLIADEPTSALDASVALQVLGVLDDLVRSRGMGLLFITHDLTLVEGFCDRVLVLEAGQIVESCAADALAAAQHPYTRRLIAARPRFVPS